MLYSVVLSFSSHIMQGSLFLLFSWHWFFEHQWSVPSHEFVWLQVTNFPDLLGTLLIWALILHPGQPASPWQTRTVYFLMAVFNSFFLSLNFLEMGLQYSGMIGVEERTLLKRMLLVCKCVLHATFHQGGHNVCCPILVKVMVKVMALNLPCNFSFCDYQGIMGYYFGAMWQFCFLATSHLKLLVSISYCSLTWFLF